MTTLELLAATAVTGAFFFAWYLVGTYAGILWTRRALAAATGSAGLAVLGYWVPGALDAMLVADALLVGLVWFDAQRAVRPGPFLAVEREAPSGFSVGHAGEVTYRWTNKTPRRA
ncbi:MAG TPA: hypothetical protein VEO93_00195, partial [Gemmatimonadales bacterium]|nr:hypothetical protein [Gemmatimonadales bacterium]